MAILNIGQLVVKGEERKEITRQINNAARTQTEVIEGRLVPREGTALFVNGQRRTIGKKSQYLLDMLTLDDK